MRIVSIRIGIRRSMGCGSLPACVPIFGGVSMILIKFLRLDGRRWGRSRVVTGLYGVLVGVGG